MRVVFGIDSLEPGGTELNAVRTAEALTRQGLKIAFAVLKGQGSLSERVRDSGIEIFETRLTAPWQPSAIPTIARMVRWLRGWQPDIVHCHDMYSNVFTQLAVRSGVRARVIASRRWSRDLMPMRYALLNDVAYRSADGILANSEMLAADLIRELGEGVRTRISVVPNFVSQNAFEICGPDAIEMRRRALGLATEEVIIGVVGNLRPEKGHRTLLRAFRILQERGSNCRLVVIGDGPERLALESLAAELNVTDAVHWLGRQPNLPNLHGLFDISVLPSDTEGFPNTVVEAMAAARPVVATRVGGVPEAVIHRETGLLTAPRDADALANALTLLMGDPALRDQLGQAGQRRASHRYAEDKVLSGLVSWYKALLSVT